MNNLSLWESVDKTDPAFTKKAKKGAYQFTSITPISQFKKATEKFGPQGIGWGVVIGSEVFIEKEYGTTIILSYDAVMYFVWDGVRGEIPIHATEKSCYQTQGANGYMKVDDESRKKVVTNAKTKGLSELGFNADVFMGQFDNHEYLQMVGNEFALEKADDKSEELARQQLAYRDECIKQVNAIKDAKTPGELKGLFGNFISRATTRGDTNQIARLNKAKDDKTKTTEVKK